MRMAILAGIAIAAGASRAAAQGVPSCPADPAQLPRGPTRLVGTVVGAVTPERAKASTAWVERRTGAKVSPDYADLPRVVVRIARGLAVSETLAAVVDGRIPSAGDRVEVLSRYRDPRSPCHFVPWTVGSAPAMS